MPNNQTQEQRCNKRRLVIMFTLTFAYMIAELAVGYIARSTSLIADAFHMLSDVIALIVAFVAITMSPKKWKKSTFGWARAEVLGALINSVFLLALCFSITIEAIIRIVNPEPIGQAIYVFGVGFGGLVINLIGLALFSSKDDEHSPSHGHSDRKGSLIQNQGRLTRLVAVEAIIPEDPKSVVVLTNSGFVQEDDGLSSNPATQSTPTSKSPRNSVSTSNQTAAAEPQIPDSTPPDSKASDANSVHGEKQSGDLQGHPKDFKQGSSASQMNLHGVILHLLADTLGSVIVVISAGVRWATLDKPERSPWTCLHYLDPVLSILAITLIVISTWPLMQEASLVLLQTIPANIDINKIQRTLVDEVPGIMAVHEFHVWQLAGDRVIASIHIVCKDVNEYTRIARQVKILFHKEGIHSTTVQAEFADSSSVNLNNEDCLLNCPPPEPGLNTDCEKNTCCGPQEK